MGFSSGSASSSREFFLQAAREDLVGIASSSRLSLCLRCRRCPLQLPTPVNEATAPAAHPTWCSSLLTPNWPSCWRGFGGYSGKNAGARAGGGAVRMRSSKLTRPEDFSGLCWCSRLGSLLLLRLPLCSLLLSPRRAKAEGCNEPEEESWRWSCWWWCCSANMRLLCQKRGRKRACKEGDRDPAARGSRCCCRPRRLPWCCRAGKRGRALPHTST
mmetsp:Transcript_9765/g.24965  ORF Transcript_9765/g.24965 Transcript_9765/m.24965 type:complete len:215 (-) Transcript_9765:100-744(-)